jgi:hypothetical protein
MSNYKIIEETKRNGDVGYYVLKKWWFMWLIQTEQPFVSLEDAKDCIDNDKKVGKKVVYTTGYGVPNPPYAPPPPKKYKRGGGIVSKPSKSLVK